MREAERNARERLRAAIDALRGKLEVQTIAEAAVGQATRLRDIALADRDDAIAARTHAAVVSARKALEPVFGTDAPPADVLPLGTWSGGGRSIGRVAIEAAADLWPLQANCQ